MPAGFGENYSSHVHRRRDEKLYLDPICNASRFEKVVPGFYGYRYRELGIITDTVLMRASGPPKRPIRRVLGV